MTLSVLFVCTANICRSPAMELWSRHTARGGTVEFASAGTHGRTDEPMDEAMAVALIAQGVGSADAAAFRSRRLTAAMIRDADLVLTAERSHRSYVLDDHAGAFRKVLTLGQAADAASRVPPGVTGRDALAELARHRAGADAAGDVGDPYRRGRQAADDCADTVVNMLTTMLPVLTRSPVASRTTTTDT